MESYFIVRLIYVESGTDVSKNEWGEWKSENEKSREQKEKRRNQNRNINKRRQKKMASLLYSGSERKTEMREIFSGRNSYRFCEIGKGK